MNSSQRLRHYLFVCLAALVALTGLATKAEATHGRYGSITWSVPNPATPNVIRIRVETAWRRSFFGAPVIGTVVGIGSVVVSADGGPVPSPSSYALNATVTSVNSVEDWIMTVQETNYTFPVATANYLLRFDVCCRISTLRDGNNDQNFRVTSRVTVRMPPNAINRPPITATLPILSLPLNIASVFAIPAADPDGDTMTFRAATTLESSLPTPVPAGFAISSAGIVSFTPTVAGLYGAQIRVTDSQGAYTVVDLILSAAPPSGLAPAITINSAPGPLALSVLYGSPVSFTIGATDPENATIYLNTGTLPAGGVTSPSLPMSLVNPSTTFTWTPTLAQLGTYVLTFGATDPVGNQATTSVTITVRTNPATITCTANGSSFEAGGSPFGLTADVADPDGGTVTVRFFVDGVERQAYIGVPVPGTATYISSTFFAVGTHTYEGRVSDGATAPESCTGAFTIVDTTPPSITVPADITATATSSGGAFVTHAASATDIGDPSPTLNCVPHSGSMFALGTSTVVCLAVDDSGNTSIAQFNVTVTDSTAPVITPVVTGTLGANGWYVTNPSLSWTVVDPETGVGSPTGCNTQAAIADTTGATFTCRATNAAHLETSVSVTLKVDTVTPASAFILTTPTNAGGTVEATSPAGAVVTHSANAFDATSGVAGAGTCAPVSGSVLPIGTNIVSCQATDQAGNTGSSSFPVTVVDTTAPAITVPANISVTATSEFGAAVTYPAATAFDAVAPTAAVYCVAPSGSMFALGTSTVICTAVDFSGNISSEDFSITVTDGTPPVITPVVAGVLGANGWYTSSASLSWTVVDPESNIASSTGCTTQPAIGDTTGLTVTCEATNGAGLTASASTTLKVDTVVPVTALTVTTATHGDGSVEATAPFGAVVTYAATASDITSGAVGTPICVPQSGSVFPIGTTTVICTATDQAGNQGSNSLPIRVVDTIAPVLTVPAAISTPGTTPGGSAVTYSATAFDLATPAVAVTCTPVSGSFFTYGATAVSCTATDAAGNSSSTAFTVTVTDPTPPVVTPVVAGAAGANGWYVSSPTLSWTVVDAETGVPSATGCGVQAGLADSTGVTFTCQATNGHNLTTSVSVTLKVDTVKPSAAIAVTTPTHGNGSVEGTSPSGAMVSYAVSVTDATSGDSGASTCMPASGSILAVGTTPVSCVAIDAAGNSNSQTFSITVVDTTAPNLMPGPLPNPVAEATGPAGAAVSYATPGILDIVDTNPTVVCAPISGSTFPLGTTSITCSATDASGNSATYPGMFTVTVQDTTPPALALNGPATQRVEGATPYVELGATAFDIFDGDVTARIAIDSSAVNANVVGTYTVFYTVTDAAGNPAQLTRTVLVEDATPPVMPALSNIAIEATGPAGAAATFVVADANDTVAGAVALVCSPPSGSTFMLGTTTVSCTATDPSGNQASGGFTVTVVDTTAPDLTVPANIDVLGIAPSGVGVTFAATATDAVTSPLVVGCLPASGSVFPYGTTTVSCSVADAAGNTSNGSFTVTVTDPTPPVVTPVVTGTLGSNGWYTSDVNVSWVVTDPESHLTSTGCGPVVVSADGIASITCSATSEGGTTEVTQVVKRDVTAPAITTPSSLIAEATGASGAVVTYAAATAVETASGLDGAVVCAPVSGSVFPIATTAVTCSAADLAGNTSSASFTVTVRDTTPPVISATAPSAGQLWPPNHQMVPLTVAVSATDITSTPVCTVTGVTSNEPQNGLGDGDTPNDWLLTGPVSLQLRAERAGKGDGRVYTVAVQCTDGFGNATTASTAVGVAKSQGKK